MDGYWCQSIKCVFKFQTDHLIADCLKISRCFGRPSRVDHEVKRLRPSWSTCWNLVSTKNTKISWVWWHMPVVPATPKAEAGELLEPRRRRLRWAEIAPLLSSLGNKSETLSQSKKYKKQQQKRNSSLKICFSRTTPGTQSCIRQGSLKGKN